MPYRNDAKAAARRDDAVRKIAKYCGSENYTITHEGASPSVRRLIRGRFPMRRASVGTSPGRNACAAEEYGYV